MLTLFQSIGADHDLQTPAQIDISPQIEIPLNVLKSYFFVEIMVD